MRQRKIEVVLNRRIYPIKPLAAAIKDFKDFIEVSPVKSSRSGDRYAINALPGVDPQEAIAEFLNFVLGSVKNKL